MSGVLKKLSRSAVSALVLFCFAVFVPGSTAWGDGEKGPQPNKPRFELAGQVVKDNRMGLIWPVNGSMTKETFSWNGAFEYIGVLNKERFAGSSRWRLPTKEEFQSLIEYARSLGYDGSGPERTIAAGLRTVGFSHIGEAEYWSSTTSLYNAADAWFVSMTSGSSGTGDKDLYLAVWPVRSGH